MAKVLISMHDAALRRSLWRLPACRCDYLDLGDQESSLTAKLDEAGAIRMPPTLQGKDFADQFGWAYSAFVGKIGIRHNTLDWWVTFAASKNRVTSRLSHNLVRLLRVDESLRRLAPDRTLLILNPPEEIRATLERHLRAQGIDVNVLGWVRSWGRYHARAVVYPILSAVLAVSRIWKRKRWLRPLARDLEDQLQMSRPSYVVKTFLYDHSISAEGRYDDTFFGALPQYLRQQRPTLILADLLGDYRTIMQRIRRCRDLLIVPLEQFYSYADVLWAAVRVFWGRLVLREGVEFWGWNVRDLVNAEIARSYASPTVVIDYLHFVCVRRLAATIPIETFFLTCENNPWERMCILALRRYAPRSKIIGYQHSVVTRASANMFVSAEEVPTAPLPDRIVTVGEAPKRIIERYGALGPERLTAGCALRSAYLFRLSPQPRRRIRRILVALDGLREIYHLINYAARELREHPEFEVTLRTHPLVSLQHVRRQIRYDLDRIGHFHQSSAASLQQDLEQADLVLYWGSTVGVEALMLGKPVIHFDRGDVLSYDPLFECTALKWVARPTDRLVDIIREIDGLSDDAFEQRRREAHAYVATYFHEVTEERLAAFVDAAAAREPADGAAVDGRLALTR